MIVFLSPYKNILHFLFLLPLVLATPRIPLSRHAGPIPAITVDGDFLAKAVTDGDYDHYTDEDFFFDMIEMLYLSCWYMKL